MNRIRLHLHGYPAVTVDGQPVTVRLKRALALLALLADAGGPRGRHWLAERLWPDADAAVGRARLRRLMHDLNGLLGSVAIRADGDALRLADDCSSDLADTAAACVPGGAIEPLLRPASDGLLEGFTLDAEGFDDWLATRRRQQRATVQRALERAVDDALARHDAPLLRALAERLLQIDDCAERGHAARWHACALDGDAAGVESAYHAAAQRLRDELGVRPSARLEAAYVQAQVLLQRKRIEHAGHRPARAWAVTAPHGAALRLAA